MCPIKQNIFTGKGSKGLGNFAKFKYKFAVVISKS